MSVSGWHDICTENPKISPLQTIGTNKITELQHSKSYTNPTLLFISNTLQLCQVITASQKTSMNISKQGIKYQ